MPIWICNRQAQELRRWKQRIPGFFEIRVFSKFEGSRMAKSSETLWHLISAKWVNPFAPKGQERPHFSLIFLEFFPCGSPVGLGEVSTKWDTRLCQTQTSIIAGRNPEFGHASTQLTRFALFQNHPLNLSKTIQKQAKSRGFTSAFVLVGAGGFEPP